MTSMLISWLALSLMVWLTAAIVPGFKVKGVGGALFTGFLFGLLNYVLGWFFFVLIGIGTLGLGFIFAFITRWVVDAIVLKITDAFTDKLTIKSFGVALIAALVMAALGTLVEYLLHLNLPGSQAEYQVSLRVFFA